MPPLNPFHLTFPHGLHIGRGVENLATTYAYIPSDTLFAALLDVSRMLGIDMDGLIQADGKRAPAFRITSAFPFAGGVRFYPMPVDLNAVFSPDLIKESGTGKIFTKIGYFSEKLVEQWLAGNWLDHEVERKNGEWRCKTAIQNGALWLTEAEQKGLPGTVWAIQTSPRLTVDRSTSRSFFFQSDRVVFAQECGLWFGAIGEVSHIRQLLSPLGEGGLGGERSSGYGGFAYHEQVAKDFPEPTLDGRTYLLSRYHPSSSEIIALQRNESMYKLVAVGGWFKSPVGVAQMRKRIWMCCEGSLIAGKPYGNAPNVRPTQQNHDSDVPHPVFRPGFAVGLNAPHLPPR